MDRERSVNTGGGGRELALGFQGWQDLKAVFLWSQFCG